jgi:hypothetical protein
MIVVAPPPPPPPDTMTRQIRVMVILNRPVMTRTAASHLQKCHHNQKIMMAMIAMQVTKERIRAVQKAIIIIEAEIASLMAIPFFSDHHSFEVMALGWHIDCSKSTFDITNPY